MHSTELFKVNKLLYNLFVLLLTSRLILNVAAKSYKHALPLAFSQQLKLLLSPYSFVNLGDMHIGLKPCKKSLMLEAQAKPL